MGRSLSQMRAAAFAGEPLTAAEVEELTRYETLASRELDALRQTLPLDEQTRVETGDEAEAFLTEAIVAMDALAADADVAGNARVIVALARMRELVEAVRFLEDVRARHTGLKRRQRRENRDRQPLAAAAKRETRALILAAIDAEKTAHRSADLPVFTDDDAARAVLKNGLTANGIAIVPRNHAPSDKEVAALVRRVGRARRTARGARARKGH